MRGPSRIDRTLRDLITVSLVLFLFTLGFGLKQAHCDEPLRLRVVLPVLVSGAALDLGSTEWALRQPGVSEGNPLAQTLNRRAALQVGFVAAETVLIRKAGRKNGKRILIGVTVVKVAVTGWNIHNARRQR